jgi:hypothetical protein
LFRMDSGSHDLVLFLGRFHPVLVHLPIGGLVLLGILEALAGFSRFKDAAANRRLVLGLTAIGSAVAALLGWVLSQGGDYDPRLLQWHKWSGFAVAAACLATFLLSWLKRLRAYRLCLMLNLVVLVVAGHFGASLTHGRGFFFRYAPAPLRSLLAGKAQAPTVPPAAPGLLPQHVFSGVVQPILMQRCSACHGPEKQKGDLRVDSHDALLRGGKSGPALVAGNAPASLLVKRLLLPLADEDHMPPEGKPQPSPAEILALQWWIDHGALPDASSSGGAGR